MTSRDEGRIVAIALLTQPELEGLGRAFRRAWPIEEARSSSEDLLKAIDEADREMEATRNCR